MLEEVASYIWGHSNSLIKNLTPFKDDAEILFPTVLMQSDCKQVEDIFFQMASTKIDFYFEVSKQLQNKVLSYLTGATQHRETGFTETNSYFISLMEKKHIQQFILPVDRFFVNLWADKKAVDLTPKYYQLDEDTNQASIFSPCTRYKLVKMID